MSTTSEQFWNAIFTRTNSYSRVGYTSDAFTSVLRTASAFFGSMAGQTVIDLGCGNGAASIFFASQGASVIALDQSPVAVRNVQMFCEDNNVTSVIAATSSAFNVADYGPVDFVFGSMILHHLEPFAEFVPMLARALKPNGRAFFYENNSASPLLIWFRTHIVGKLWVPKHGDAEEFPLSPAEVKLLKPFFDVKQVFPELLLFRLIPIYLLRRRLLEPFSKLDNLAFHVKSLRKYSYRQYLFLSR